MKPRTRTLNLIGLAGLLLFSSGCMVGPKYQRPSVPAPIAYGESLPAGWKEAQPTDGVIRDKWWEVYQDPQLNALEERINISNQNVLASEAQFRASQAAVRTARSDLYPTVNVGSSISAERTPPALRGVSAGTGIHAVYSIPLQATYAPDVFGGIRRAVAAQTATAQATAAQLENVRLLFHAEVASDYFQLRGVDGQVKLFSDQVKSYEEYLQLTRKRYDSGVASTGDIEQARTQLETTRAQLKDLGVQRTQLEHAVAVLIGRPPAGFGIPPAPLKNLPPVTPVGIPSTLLERRPDIAAQERQVAAANEEIGVATSALYPSITLTAGGGSETANFLKLLTGPSYLWTIGGQLTQTIFDKGRRRAQISLTQATYDTTVADYRQTVLTAFQQVEDNLSALRVLAEEAGIQDSAVAAAQESLRISTAQYEGGITSYLQVLTTQTIAQEDQRVAVDIQTRRMLASVALIQALGGGWDVSKLPPV
jgi:NodT family efflux transporter outer membrane factor (OMF) lipoprotein